MPAAKPPAHLGDDMLQTYAFLSSDKDDVRTALQRSVDFLCGSLEGEIGKPDSSTARREECRELCRQGNPFPLVALYWPELVVPQDSLDYAFFLRDMETESLYEGATDHQKGILLDLANPVLRLDYWQRLILVAMFDITIAELFIKGCTGAGKGASTSMGVVLWFDVFESSRSHITSRDASHAQKNVFGDISTWYSTMDVPGAGRMLSTGLVDGERHYVKILNPDPTSPTAGEAFSGAHGDNTLYLYDEASACPSVFYENCLKNARKVIALSNPRTLFGFFRQGFVGLENENKTGTVNGAYGPRQCVTIGGEHCANVRYNRLKKPVSPRGGVVVNGRQYEEGQRITGPDVEAVRPLIPRQMDLALYNANKADPDPNKVAVYAHGCFPAEDQDTQIILPSWIIRHSAEWQEGLVKVECFGLDVARSADGDRTVLVSGGIDGIARIEEWQYANTVYHHDHTLELARNFGIDLRRGQNPVCVDMDGLGAGVGDMLKASGVWVIEMRGNELAEVDRRTYGNMRAECYALLGRRLNPDDRWGDKLFHLPPHPDLGPGLAAPEKVFKGDPFRFYITPKNPQPNSNIVSVKEKLDGKSPDVADATVYFFRAVRALHALNDYFAQAAAPLTLYPLPERTEEEQTELKQMDLKSYFAQRYGAESRLPKTKHTSPVLPQPTANPNHRDLFL